MPKLAPFSIKTYFSLLSVLSLFSGTLVGSSCALAARHYFEINGGADYIGSMDWLFPSASGTRSDRGVALGLGYFYNVTPSNRFVQIHLGLRQDLLTAQLDAVQYSVTAPLAVLRIHFLPLYISAGFAPLVMQRNHPSWGLSGLQLADSTYAFLGEAGMMYGINPDLSLGIQAGAWLLMQQGFLSSNYSTTGSISLRFYIKDGKGGSGSTTAPEYSGWRYIGK